MSQVKRFEVGRIYQTRFPGDHDLIIKIKIVGRTERTIKYVVLDNMKKTVKVARPFIYNGQETFYPFGKFSMCPVINAGD